MAEFEKDLQQKLEECEELLKFKMTLSSKSKGTTLFFSIIIALIMILTLGLGLYLLFWPITVMQVNDTKMLTPQVSLDNYVKYEFCYDKYGNYSAYITRALIGKDNDGVGRTYPLTMVAGYLPDGKDVCVTEAAHIPPYVIPGTYWIRTRIDYQINTLRVVSTEFDTIGFEVTGQ